MSNKNSSQVLILYLLSLCLVTEMLLAILSICSQEELDSESDGEEEAQEEETIRTEAVAARRQAIKNKIMAVGRMQKVFQILRFVLCSSNFVDNVYLMLGV